MEIYKEYQKTQLHIITGILYLVIVAGIILNNGCKNKNSDYIELPLIEKPCLNDMLFVQSQINFDDTLTINNFYISDSFFTRNGKHFEIKINERVSELKKIKFPIFTTCNGVNKTIGNSVIYNQSIIPPNCNYYFVLNEDSTIIIDNVTGIIHCRKRQPNMIDFPELEK